MMQVWLDGFSFFKKNYETKFCNSVILFTDLLPKSIKHLINIRNWELEN